MDWLKSTVLTLFPHIISFLLGYFSSLLVARQTRNEKNLSFSLISREIIFENFDKDEFELKYKGTQVENLYVLIIRVWNKGRDRILSSDISPAKPVTLRMDNSARILGAPKIYTPNDGIKFEVTKTQENSFALSFDCLNEGDWAVLEFKYTGNPKATVDLSGRIFGQKRDVRFGNDEADVSLSEWLTTLVAMLFITGIAVSFPIAIVWILILLITSDWRLPPANEWPYLLQIFLSSGSLALVLGLFYLIGRIKRRFTEPEGYMTPEDLQYSNIDSLKAGWVTVFTRKRYKASNSIYDYGQLVTFDSKEEEPSEESKPET